MSDTCFKDDNCPSFYECLNATSEIQGYCKCSEEGGGTDPVLDIMLPALVLLLMYGMGCTIYFDDLRNHFRRPKPLLIGMLSQFCVMPLVAFALGYAFDLSPESHISLIIIGCTPGGTTSNLFAYWAGGDTSLSIAMTTTSTTVALGMQLALIKLLTDLPGGLVDRADASGSSIKIPYTSMVAVLFIIVVPVALGIYTRAKSMQNAIYGARVGSIAGFVVVLVAIVYGSITQAHIFASDGSIWAVSILLGLCGFGFGYGVATASGMSSKVARTVALETGIQNGPLAIGIIQLSFAHDECLQSQMIIFPLFYSVWIVVESMVFALLLNKFAPHSVKRKLEPGEFQAFVVPDAAVKPGARRRRARLAGAASAGSRGAVDAEGGASQLPPLYEPDEGAPALDAAFERAATKFAKRPLYGTRALAKPDPKKPDKPKFGEYKWTTYGDVFAAAQRVGAFLVSDGGGKLAPGALVGLFAPNRAVRERARARARTHALRRKRARFVAARAHASLLPSVGVDDRRARVRTARARHRAAV